MLRIDWMAELRRFLQADPERVPESSDGQHVRLRLFHHRLRLCRDLHGLARRNDPLTRRSPSEYIN